MTANELTTGDFTDADEPFSLFGTWLKDAEKNEVNDPNAVALATVDPDGLPNVRMVLLKGFDEHGFVFYTNFESQKGQELLSTRKAAMCFHWKSLRRQVRLRGPVEIVTAEEADEYFRSRPRGSRIGAWASKQSRPLESRFALEKAVAEFTARHAIGEIRGRNTGPVSAFGRPPSSSGTTVRSGCTIASSSVAPSRKEAGRRCGCIREVRRATYRAPTAPRVRSDALRAL